METLLVYGLVVVFFVLLIPVIYFLMQDPIGRTDQESAKNAQKRGSLFKIQPEKTVSYGILAALFALICVLTVLEHRTRT
jgi:ABC-type Fe3+ transport system permease subunit